MVDLFYTKIKFFKCNSHAEEYIKVLFVDLALFKENEDELWHYTEVNPDILSEFGLHYSKYASL